MELLNSIKPDKSLETDIRELRTLLENDDICKFGRKHDYFSKKIPIEEMLRLVLEAHDLFDYSTEDQQAFRSLMSGLAPKPGTDPHKSLETDQNEATIFYNALLFSGSLSGTKSEATIDLDEAIKLFEVLKASDPTNGAYPLFLAVTKSRKGYSTDEVRQELLKALSAPRFDTFMQEIAQRLFELGLSSPSRLLLANTAIAELPIPDMVKPHSLIRSYLAQNDSEVAEKSLSFGKLLMEKGNAYGPTKREFIYWSALEHEIGHLLFLKAWKQLHGEATPPAFDTDYRTFDQKPDDYRSKFRELWGRVLRSTNECPRDEIKMYFAIDSKLYVEHRQRLGLKLIKDKTN
jgi:hypothetical protein